MRSLDQHLREIRDPDYKPTPLKAKPKKQPLRSFHKCPRCKQQLKPAVSFLGSPSTFWLECVNCNTFVNTFVPLPHQEAVLKDPHPLIGNFGGYGTGKSVTSIEQAQKHLLITPTGHFMVTANISYQYEQTFKKEFERNIPAAFVKDYSAKAQTMTLINNAILSYRPLDDPNKLRSNNLSGFLIIEGSESKAEAFHQLKTRLRNTAATLQLTDPQGFPVFEQDQHGREHPVIAHDWRKGLVESNPDAGWIKNDVLLVADKIEKHGEIYDDYTEDQDTVEKDPYISAHVASTHVNTFLPKDYISMIAKNKPEWWINRYIRSSFMYAEGLVYPNARNVIIPAFEIDPAWKRVVAFDYGLSDNAVFMFGAVDEVGGMFYIYKEAVVNDSNIETLANLFKENAADIPVGGYLCSPIMDPKSNKRDYDKKDLATHFLDYGIAFKPGHINLDARILRLNTYIETDRIRIFNTCTSLIGEILDYKFEERTLDAPKKKIKPKDSNNHAINTVEWMTMELPSNPANLKHGVYGLSGRNLTTEEIKQRETPWQLRDADTTSTKEEAQWDYY